MFPSGFWVAVLVLALLLALSLTAAARHRLSRRVREEAEPSPLRLLVDTIFKNLALASLAQ